MCVYFKLRRFVGAAANAAVAFPSVVVVPFLSKSEPYYRRFNFKKDLLSFDTDIRIIPGNFE